MLEEFDIKILNEIRESIFKIFDDIRAISIGFNVLQNAKSEERWKFLKQEYYEKLRSQLLYEQEYIKKFKSKSESFSH